MGEITLQQTSTKCTEIERCSSMAAAICVCQNVYRDVVDVQVQPLALGVRHLAPLSEHAMPVILITRPLLRNQPCDQSRLYTFPAGNVQSITVRHSKTMDNTTCRCGHVPLLASVGSAARCIASALKILSLQIA